MGFSTGIVGAGGFVGVELVRLVLAHPQFDLALITSNELAGRRLDEEYPAFLGRSDLVFSRHDTPELDNCEVVFLAVPHTAAMKLAPALLNAGKAVIDLSADFRLKDASVYERHYGVAHTCPELLARAAFGIPELFANELARSASEFGKGEGALVACAGCYPTATSLAAAPALRAAFAAPDSLVVVDALSGVSGAGKKASARTHFCFADENAEAYGVGNHRHMPEIEQILGVQGRLVFTPYLVPMKRGMLSSVKISLDPSKDISLEEIRTLYKGFYADSPFVQVLEEGMLPKTSMVTGTNNAHIAYVVQPALNVLIVLCAIDNLGKGAASQALQCANIVCGLAENCGLDKSSIAVW